VALWSKGEAADSAGSLWARGPGASRTAPARRTERVWRHDVALGRLPRAAFVLAKPHMDTTRIDQASARLSAALARAEAAARALPDFASVDPQEYAGLQERHSRLKQTVATSLRQLDEILAGMAQ